MHVASYELRVRYLNPEFQFCFTKYYITFTSCLDNIMWWYLISQTVTLFHALPFNLRGCCIIPGVAVKFNELLSSFTNCHVMTRVYFMFSPLSASLSTTSLIRFGRKTFYQTKKHYSSVKARALISNMVIKMFTSLQHFNIWKSIVTQGKCKCYGFQLTNLYMKHC